MATVRWLGAAQDISQIDSYVFADTWAQGDTVDFEINNKHLIYTVGTAVTTADVAAGCRRMLLSNGTNVGAINSESWNFGGKQIAEFTEISSDADAVSVSSSTLTIRWTPGVPVTITATATTAGDGDVTPSADQAATGKNFFDNADNWEGGSVPSATNTLLFDQGSVDVKYALDNTTLDYNLVRKNGYTGNIGLPAMNSLGYVEYRNRYLAIPITGTTGNQLHVIGEQFSNLPTSGYTYIDLGTNTGATQRLDVHDSSVPATGYAVHVVGGRSLNARVRKGSVAYGMDLVANATTISQLKVGFLNNKASDAVVLVGSNASMISAGVTIAQEGGTLYIENTDSYTSIDITGGTCYQNNTSELSVVQIYAGATLVARSGSCDDTMRIFGNGTLKIETLIAYTTTTVEIHKGAAIHDPNGMLGNVSIDFRGTWPGDPSNDLVFLPNRNWTAAAI